MAREVEITIRSATPSAIVAQLTAYAEAHGGYVVNSFVHAAAPGEVGAELSLRLPNSQLEPALELMRLAGHVESESRRGDDVSVDVVDTEARLTARRAFEKRLLELLANAHSADDMLKVEAELSRVRTEIEQLTGRSRSLAQQTEMALVKVSIQSPDAYRAAARAFGTRLKEALFSAKETAESIIIGCVELLGGLVPLVAIGALLWLPIRIWRRRIRRKRRAAAESELPETSTHTDPLHP